MGSYVTVLSYITSQIDETQQKLCWTIVKMNTIVVGKNCSKTLMIILASLTLPESACKCCDICNKTCKCDECN